MARPTIVVDSSIWKVYPTGRMTVYGKDELGLLFELGTGPERKRRFTRYSPLGSKDAAPRGVSRVGHRDATRTPAPVLVYLS